MSKSIAPLFSATDRATTNNEHDHHHNHIFHHINHNHSHPHPSGGRSCPAVHPPHPGHPPDCAGYRAQPPASGGAHRPTSSQHHPPQLQRRPPPGRTHRRAGEDDRAKCGDTSGWSNCDRGEHAFATIGHSTSHAGNTTSVITPTIAKPQHPPPSHCSATHATPRTSPD